MTEIITLSERIAIMETELAHIQEQNRVREAVQERTAKSIESVNTKLDNILNTMERYKGFIGGILFVASAIGAFLKLGLPYITKALDK